MKKISFVLTVVFTILGFLKLEAQNVNESSKAQSDWFTDARLKLLGGEKSADGKYYAYISVNAADKEIKSLSITGYDNVLTLNKKETVELTDMLLLSTSSDTGISIYSAPIAESSVYRINAELTNEDASSEVLKSYYYEIENGKEHAFEYVSDMPYEGKAGWGDIKIDCSPDNLVINLLGQIYAKGIGLHSQGWIMFAFDTGKYHRFVSDAAIQKNYSGRADAQLKFSMEGVAKEEVVSYFTEVTQNKKVSWDYELPVNIKAVIVDFFKASYGNGEAHSCLGGARLYLTPHSRKAQSIHWNQSQEIYAYRPVTIDLNATSSSGLPVYYRIAQGKSNAEIVDGSVLRINKFSSDIVVEAYQAGNEEWESAPFKTSVFKIYSGSKVDAGSTVELSTGDVLDELIVYGNGVKTGEVNVKGLPQVKKIIYKCKFKPSEWNFVSFPSNVNIDEISNLRDLGYELNAPLGKPSYYILEYDGKNRAENPSASSWKRLKTPYLEARKGYIMGINNVATTDSVEVTFNIDNTAMALSGNSTEFHVSVDLSQCEPQSVQTFYVRPTNVKGNALKMDVEFNPSDYSELPVNHEIALKNARVTHTPGYEGIRITLPDATPAKVAIFDSKGKKLIKAVHYVSPMMIDVSDLKAGEYKAFISYGNAYAEKGFTIPKR